VVRSAAVAVSETVPAVLVIALLSDSALAAVRVTLPAAWIVPAGSHVRLWPAASVTVPVAEIGPPPVMSAGAVSSTVPAEVMPAASVAVIDPDWAISDTLPVV
jgi:hypothetical protein